WPDRPAGLAAAPGAAAQPPRYAGDQDHLHSGPGPTRSAGAGAGGRRADSARLELGAHHTLARTRGAGTSAGCRAGHAGICPAPDGTAGQGSEGQALMLRLLFIAVLSLVAPFALGQDAGALISQGNNPLSIPAITLSTDAAGQQEYSVSLQILLIMTALSFIPAFVMLMTSFTRIIIVFSILRQALGLQQTPSNQILIGLTIFLTLFIMAPVFDQINRDALQPYLNQQ